jgi:hypothetical protein
LKFQSLPILSSNRVGHNFHSGERKTRSCGSFSLN